MDFDFTRQLLASLRTRQIRLGDNFESPGRCFVLLRLDRRDPLDFIAFCEATFAEEATTGVSDDLARLIIIFRVHRLHFFFNSLPEKKTDLSINSIFQIVEVRNLPLGSDNCLCD